MTDTTLNQPVASQIIENFRYDLLKAMIFIIIFAATIVYANKESGKYYLENHNKTTLMKK